VVPAVQCKDDVLAETHESHAARGWPDAPHPGRGNYVAALFHVAPFARDFLVLIGGTLAEKPIANQTIVAVFPAGEDRTSLIKIFGRCPMSS
jgi:hypothetical protein